MSDAFYKHLKKSDATNISKIVPTMHVKDSDNTPMQVGDQLQGNREHILGVGTNRRTRRERSVETL
eukprot:6245314-Pyramimonas_sp.AAC.1